MFFIFIEPGIKNPPLKEIKVSLPHTLDHPEQKCGSPAAIVREKLCGVALGGLEMN